MIFPNFKSSHCGLYTIAIVLMMVSGAVPLATLISAGGGAPLLSGLDPQDPHFLVKFTELPDSNQRQWLSLSYGIEFHQYMQDRTYLVKVNPDELPAIAALPTVLFIGQLGQEDKIAPALFTTEGTVDVQIILHNDVAIPSVLPLLYGLGVESKSYSDVARGIIRARADAGQIVQIAALTSVRWIDEDPEPVAFMDLITSNEYMGHDTAQLGGFTGQGILAEVQDNGIDLDHPDLANVLYTDGYVVEDNHGTCTSGIVFGNGDGDIKALGIAYEATGAFSDWGTGRDISITNLWNGDFNEGAAGMNGLVQSNSWSSGVQDGLYDTNPSIDDQSAVDYPYLLALWAAGNGNDGTDPGDISADAIAKNVIGVGAVFHKDTATQSDDEWILQSYGNTPSRGPAADGRQKPDLCGPFDCTYTVDVLGLAGYSSTDYYAEFGGTSGATPNVAGSAVLVYDMYQADHFGNNPTNAWPHSSTVKAILISDAFQYPLTSATRNEQGWGTPDIENTYTLGADKHVIEDYPQSLDSGDSWSRTVYSDGSEPLKITLCWIDPAASESTLSGRALINNLDLKVTSPGGSVYWGNNGLYTNLWSTPGTSVNQWSLSSSHEDDLNNVENVFVESPEVGTWNIEIIGRNGDMAMGPQDFSLVASGAMGISSMGTVSLDAAEYSTEGWVDIEVGDLDVNTKANVAESVDVSISSDSEASGETVTLFETGLDTNRFTGTIEISETDGNGVLQVSGGDTIMVEYQDADDGTGSPAVAVDTAYVNGPSLPPSGMTVDRWGISFHDDDAIDGQVTTGTAAGTYMATQVQDDSYHAITERWSTGKYSLLVTYTIDIQETATDPLTLHIDAFSSGEEIVVTYSVNGGASQSAGSITATTDTDTYSTTTLSGAGASDTVTVTFDDLVDDSNQDDTLYVDHLFIRSGDGTSPSAHNTLNWTLSPDDGGGDDDVVEYRIFRSSEASGPWGEGAFLASLPAGSSSYTDLNAGDADSTLWWYLVRANDTVGNLELNSDMVQEPGGTGALLSTGLHLISLGKIQADDSLATVLSSISGSYSSVETYDASTGAWEHWEEGKSAEGVPDSLAALDHTRGFYINMSGPAVLSIAGDEPLDSNNDITLYPGWNLVGFPSTQASVLASTALSGVSYSVIERYDSSSGSKVVLNPAVDSMVRGQGYWIYLDSATSELWDVP